MTNTDLVADIIAYENGDLSEYKTLQLFVELHNNGMIYQLQGSYGRTLQSFLDGGSIVTELMQNGKRVARLGDDVDVEDDEDQQDSQIPESIDGSAVNRRVSGSISDGGEIAVNEVSEPDDQEGETPKLLVEKVTTFKVDYNDLDEFLSEVFNIQFEIVAVEELNNHCSKEYSVKAEPMDEYWSGRFNDGVYNTRQLLNEACNRGLIEPGEYVIAVSWFERLP